MPDVADLIAQSYSAEAAKTFRAFEPSDADFDALKQVGRELQIVFKPIPGACIMMSALLILGLETLTKAPAYLVAGSLAVGATRVFGDGGAVDAAKAFGQSNPSWDARLGSIREVHRRYVNLPNSLLVEEPSPACQARSSDAR